MQIAGMGQGGDQVLSSNEICLQKFTNLSLEVDETNAATKASVVFEHATSAERTKLWMQRLRSQPASAKLDLIYAHRHEKLFKIALRRLLGQTCHIQFSLGSIGVCPGLFSKRIRDVNLEPLIGAVFNNRTVKN